MAPYISAVGNAGGWSHVYGRKGTSNAPFPSLPSSSLAYASRRNIRFLRDEQILEPERCVLIAVRFSHWHSVLRLLLIVDTLSPSFNFFVFFRIVFSF